MVSEVKKKFRFCSNVILNSVVDPVAGSVVGLVSVDVPGPVDVIGVFALYENFSPRFPGV